MAALPGSHFNLIHLSILLIYIPEYSCCKYIDRSLC
jgi:hypothetical protein